MMQPPPYVEKTRKGRAAEWRVGGTADDHLRME